MLIRDAYCAGMAATSTTRRAVSAVALTVGVWALLAGLFAMHALPMQQPQAMTAAMASPAVAGGSAVDRALHHQSAAHDTQLVGSAGMAGGADATTAPHAVPGERQVASVPAAGCGGVDLCTATLRTPDTTAAPAVITVVGPVAPALQRSALAAPPTPRPRPPDLDTLQISRT